NAKLSELLQAIDLGSSIAEQDNLLESARVETSTFSDLFNDRVDLVPGTKGSGKSALYRIFVEFLPNHLLKQNKAVVAHGVDRVGDTVFHIFKKEFEELDENDFVNFWCIYIVSLVHEQFIKNPQYADFLKGCKAEIEKFKQTSALAGIPEIKAKKSLREMLAWVLNSLKAISPRLKYKPPGDSGEFEISLFGETKKDANKNETADEPKLPKYIDQLREDLVAILEKCGLSIWFMIDKLDEIFPRRSPVERLALRALLRTMRIFSSPRIRIKIFLRDDMLGEIAGGDEGFTALSHVYSTRKADTLRWSEEQIISMIAKRLFANTQVAINLKVDPEQLNASLEYRKEALYKVFPKKVFTGAKQSDTLRWIYHHTADANEVVTPRDVIILLTRAIQHQINIAHSDPSGTQSFLISSQAIIYGLEELSKEKKDVYLRAEFPHLWSNIEKFIGGKAIYSKSSLQALLGKNWESVATDLMSIGLLKKSAGTRENTYTIPFLYRDGLEITQGRAID
ncbi:MAG: hypothetical protein Q8Q17_02000, partial [bacterium]|nr:hypothetical protein [bacterium]